MIQSDTPSFWKRLFSLVFDLLIINIVIFWPFQGLFQKYLTTSISLFTNNAVPSRLYFALFIISILALLYFTFFEYYVSQTPGQMICNLEVQSLNGTLGFWRCVARNIYVLPYFPFFILWAVEPIYLAIYRQRLFEKLTATKTVLQTGRILHEYNLKKV